MKVTPHTYALTAWRPITYEQFAEALSALPAQEGIEYTQEEGEYFIPKELSYGLSFAMVFPAWYTTNPGTDDYDTKHMEPYLMLVRRQVDDSHFKTTCFRRVVEPELMFP